MPEGRIRVEIGFDGGGAISGLVPEAEFEEFRGRLERREDGVVQLNVEDGSYFVVLARVDYVKRLSREAQIGFGGTG